MEKKGIVTERGELNRNIQKANRPFWAQIGKLKDWLAGLLTAREATPEKSQPLKSPALENLLTKYSSAQREKSRKYSQGRQQKHAADELKTVSQAVNYLAELDAAISSVNEKSDAIRSGMKVAEQRIKELQKLIEYGKNHLAYKPIHGEHKQILWKGKQEKYTEAHRAELTLWNALSSICINRPLFSPLLFLNHFGIPSALLH